MANFKPNESKKSKGAIITTLVFAIIGAICLIIGYQSELLWWLKNVGIVLLIIVAPIALWIIYRIVINQIKDM